MKRMAQMVLASMFVLLAGSQSWAIEASFKQEELLNGITIHYRYSAGADLEVSFYDDMLMYTSLVELREVMEQDKNKDGKVTRDEFRAEEKPIPPDITAEQLEKQFAERDKNGDGTITEKELFLYHDKNGDGGITEEEARPTEPGNKDIPYHAKQIGPNMYMVFWHEPDLNAVTLVINFDTSTLYGCAVLNYPDIERREAVFHGAIIQGVKKD